MVLKKVEGQGKVSEKSGNFYMDIEWQPCPGIFCSKNCRTQVIHILKFLMLYIFLSKICPFEAEVCWQLAKINLENCL